MIFHHKPYTWDMASSYFTKLQVDKLTAGIVLSSSISMVGSTACSTKGGIKTYLKVYYLKGCFVDSWGMFGQPVAGGVSHIAGVFTPLLSLHTCWSSSIPQFTKKVLWCRGLWDIHTTSNVGVASHQVGSFVPWLPSLPAGVPVSLTL